MQVEKIDLRETQSITDYCLDYLENKDSLHPFFGLRPEIESFEAQIKQKKFTDQNRKVLCDVLNQQYQHLQISSAVKANLDDLNDANTYTVTTGHQLNIFTGPLYFIYKIATAINACKSLKEKYPDHNFVPVYWMASEDHDFEEISYFHLFGKKYHWQTDQRGAVGRMDTNGLEAVIADLPEKVSLFERAYTEHKNLADAVRFYVNELFGEQGIIVLDADESALKELIAPVIKDDLTNHTANTLVEQTNAQLKDLGYKPQIFSRHINFFYLKDGMRERIILEGNTYQVNNTELTFTHEEILNEVDDHPERFSPNVVMRPLYEEMILPNLAYIGGPAEMVYWLQLKAVFENYQEHFPILLPRNFALYINAGARKRMDKLALTPQQIFKSAHELKSDYLARNGEKAMSLNGEVDDLKKVYEELAEKAATVDASLKGFVAAEHAKAAKGLDNIAKRLKKSEEQKHETTLNQIGAIKDKLFPGGALQERHDNFLNFYINNPEFVNQVITHLDAFDIRMHVMIES